MSDITDVAPNFIASGPMSIGELAGTVLNDAGEYHGRSIWQYLQGCCYEQENTVILPVPLPGDTTQPPPEEQFVVNTDCGQISFDVDSRYFSSIIDGTNLKLEGDAASAGLGITTENNVLIKTHDNKPLELEGEAVDFLSSLKTETNEPIQFESATRARYVLYNYNRGQKTVSYAYTQNWYGNVLPPPGGDGYYRAATTVNIPNVSPGVYTVDVITDIPGTTFKSIKSWTSPTMITECDRDIDITSSCNNVDINLGFDLLSAVSPRGIADYYHVKIYEGDEYEYINRPEIVSTLEFDGTCLKTEDLECIESETGEPIEPQGWFNLVEYSSTGESISNEELECLLTEVGWVATDETIDFEVNGRAVDCIKHETQEREAETNCILTQLCDSLLTERGRCLQYEGWAKHVDCNVVFEGQDPTVLIDPVAYPLATEAGQYIMDEDGVTYIEQQGTYTITRLETEDGQGIFTQQGNTIERETDELLITTEQGRVLDLNQIAINSQNPYIVSPLIQEQRKLIYSTYITDGLSAVNINIPAPAEYYVEVQVYDDVGMPVKAASLDKLYVPSCDCIETEVGTCLETDSYDVLTPEYTPDVVIFDGVCLSTESNSLDCIQTETGIPLEPEGFYADWQQAA